MVRPVRAKLNQIMFIVVYLLHPMHLVSYEQYYDMYSFDKEKRKYDYIEAKDKLPWEINKER